MPPPRKQRADLFLVEHGLAASREQAQRLIMAGSVFADGQPVRKPSDLLATEAKVAVRGREKFVSRGGYKLEHALNVFVLDVRGKIVVDIGASTGGFTDCVLQRGAQKVYAVDVGQGQLAWSLQQDARVVMMDKVNARHLKPENFAERADFVTLDTSFISLTKLLPSAVALLKEGGCILALIKPQFEAGRDHVGKGGVVKDELVRQQVVQKIVAFGQEKLGLTCLGTTESPLLGPAGNKEFWAAFRK